MNPQRKAVERLTFDLVVAGGGLAGLCAALAAARHGVKTALVQDRPVFGGNSSSEIRVVPYGSSHGSAWANETGIAHELILEDRATNHEHFFDHGMVNSLYDLTLEEAARREPNLTYFLNTSIRGVESEPLLSTDPAQRRITAIYGSQLGSEKELAFYAPQFIDATGDGTVGALAGALYRYGREARHEFHEPLAPLEADAATLGSTITMRARKLNRPVKYVPPPWIQVYTSLEEIGLDRELYHITRDIYGGYWWLEVNTPFHQIDDNQRIREELHRHVLGVWNYIKNYSEYKEEAANYVLDWVGMIPGKRESRRLVGDIILTEHDCHTDRNWPDSVAYASWWIDLHIKGGILNKQDPGERENIDKHYKYWIRIAPFSLPLRSFYSRNIENLWMTGRLLSVTHVALGPTRVQLTLAAQGQAVGTAAAYAVRQQITPRQAASPEGEHIQIIRQQLLRDDIHILGLHNADPADLARSAKAIATSEQLLDFGTPDEKRWVTLDMSRAQVVPLTHSTVEAVACYLKNERAEATILTAELQEMRRIWDREPGTTVCTHRVCIPAHFQGWITIPFNAQVTPYRPHRVVLHATPETSWAQGTRLPTG
ncbi:MAG: FAD-dependent oxidoreductase, partial [Ktedonobacteraceae bacterium]|nr:FAD-dependent oxidoreductase [Ktedonobacteraceae bacterium]